MVDSKTDAPKPQSRNALDRYFKITERGSTFGREIRGGVVANFPLALATGLGLNAFVAFGIASQMSWVDAMGLVVLEGLVILVLVLTGLRKAVFDAVPKELKVA